MAPILGLVTGKVITLPGPLLEDAKDNKYGLKTADGRSDGTSDHANRTGMHSFQCRSKAWMIKAEFKGLRTK